MRRSTLEFLMALREDPATTRRADEALFEILRTCCTKYAARYGDRLAVRVGNDGQLDIAVVIDVDKSRMDEFNKILKKANEQYGGTRKWYEKARDVKDSMRGYFDNLSADTDPALDIAFILQEDQIGWYARNSDKELFTYQEFKYEPEDGEEDAPDDGDPIDVLFNPEFYSKSSP